MDWQGAVITQKIYDARSRTTRFIPVLIDLAHEDSIPEPLRGQSRYCLASKTPTETLTTPCSIKRGAAPGEHGLGRGPDALAGPAP